MNKKRLFLLVVAAGLLLTCTNHYVIELLKAPSELSALNVTAYSGSTLLEGGVAFEPGFSQDVRDYTVYIPEETTHFVIKPQFDGKGTVLCLNYDRDENTGPENLEFRIAPDENELELILTVQRENLAPGEYRLSVTRSENVPMPKGIVVSVEPSIGAFFLDRGVVPELSVTANAPEGGGVFSYQWFRNYDNNNRTGTRIEGATEVSYRLSEAETSRAETVYYYVEITNNVNGKIGSMESMTRSITFIDKEDVLDIKSRDMVRVEGGTVPEKINDVTVSWSSGDWDNWEPTPLPWETAGFSMGKYPVTWELWKLVFDFAEAGGYSFSNIGNQGAEEVRGNSISTRSNPRPVGNKLHPVTMVSWNDCVVWCNAYSEMEGLEPVYRDIRGNILRDSREPVSNLVDNDKISGKNGYRLPSVAEWEYAARGADPTKPSWVEFYSNTSNWEDTCWVNRPMTGEVGSMKPNSIGLHDMGGLVSEWGTTIIYILMGTLNYEQGSYRIALGASFLMSSAWGGMYTTGDPTSNFVVWSIDYSSYMGLRVIRDLEPGATP